MYFYVVVFLNIVFVYEISNLFLVVAKDAIQVSFHLWIVLFSKQFGNLLTLLHLVELHRLQMTEQFVDLVDDAGNRHLHSVNSAEHILKVVASHLSHLAIIIDLLVVQLISDLEAVLLGAGLTLVLEVAILVAQVTAGLGHILAQLELLNLVQLAIAVLIVLAKDGLDLHVGVASFAQLVTPRAKVKGVLAGHLLALEYLLDVQDAISSQRELVASARIVHLEIVAQHELGLRLGNLLLHLVVALVDDGHEHVEENEEANEHKRNEIHGTQHRKVGT